MADPAPQARRLQPATIALAAAGLIAAGVLVYTIAFRQDGATAAADTNSVSTNAMATGQMPSVQDMLAGLVEQVRRNPDDHEGWFRLGTAYRAMEDFQQANQAFRRAAELQPRNAEYVNYLAEALLIGATRANQPVPAEAEQQFRRALEIEPGNAMARFYLATIKDDRGDHRGAVDDLIALLRNPPAGAPLPSQVRDSAVAIAQRNNIDISGRLPPAPTATAGAVPGAPGAPGAPGQSVATAAIPGPSPEQMRAASGMTPTQQSAMGRDMVERLAGRLRQNPRDANRWIMLMRSRMVLNEPQRAQEALRSALAAFQNDNATQNQLRQAARELGVPGG